MTYYLSDKSANIYNMNTKRLYIEMREVQNGYNIIYDPYGYGVIYVAKDFDEALKVAKEIKTRHEKNIAKANAKIGKKPE